MFEISVVYSPKILTCLKEICDEFGVGESTVRMWVRSGAPISVDGHGKRLRYSAETASLYVWRLNHTHKKE